MIALPARSQGKTLKYEWGNHWIGKEASHRNIRILVVGCGTLEALVVAQMHPYAQEIVAVDISRTSLRQSQWRMRLRRLAEGVTLRRWWGETLPPIRHLLADILHWEGDGMFDYIIASNVLHHLADPQAGLQRLSQWLKPEGLLRLRTYPKQSRLWIRESSRWLRANGLHQHTQGLHSRVQKLIRSLPTRHPIRIAVMEHRENYHLTGLVDAFFHAWETPLAPLAWEQAAQLANLRLVGEDQTEESQSTFLSKLCPVTSVLTRWQKLQLLDDLLELTANPILWLQKSTIQEKHYNSIDYNDIFRYQEEDEKSWLAEKTLEIDRVIAHWPDPFYLHARAYWELRRGAKRVKYGLESIDISLEALWTILKEELGPYWDESGIALPLLSLGEYDLETLLQSPPPWDEEDWDKVEKSVGKGWRLYCQGIPAPDNPLAQQAEWLQGRFAISEGRCLVEPKSHVGLL